MPVVQSAMWTSSGEPGVGTTGKGRMKMAGREMELMLEVNKWDDPDRRGLICNRPSREKINSVNLGPNIDELMAGC
jgi:hypothetical protein